MAPVTLERLAEGIRRANAAGDVATVKKLGLAYRQMQGQPGPPPGAEPGSRAYADWAMAQARAGKELPQVSEKPPEVTDTYHDLGGNALAAGGSFIEGVPILGPSLLGVAQQARGAIQGMSPEEVQTEFDAVKEANPITATAGNVAGSVAALAPLGATALGGRLLGTVGSTGQRVIAGAASGAALSGADTAARGGNAEEIGRNTLIGAGLGMAFPAAGALKNKLASSAAQSKAVTQAIADAPGSAELRSAASALFENSRAANAGVNTDTFADLAAKLVQKAKSADIDPQLDGEAMAVYRRMVEMAQEGFDTGGVTLSRLHNLRQLAQDVAIEAKKPRTQRFAGDLVDGLDELIANLKPDQMVGAGGKQAANDLLEGISTWSRAKKLSLIEEAVTKAGYQKSGLENGLRLQFLAILRDPRKRKLFSDIEIKEIEKVAHGTLGNNLLNLLGKFGFGVGNSSTNALGGAIGAMTGGIPGVLAASAARKGSEILTGRAAERAAKVVATPGIQALPMLPAPRGAIPPALLPLETTKKRGPVEIRVPY